MLIKGKNLIPSPDVIQRSADTEMIVNDVALESKQRVKSMLKIIFSNSTRAAYERLAEY